MGGGGWWYTVLKSWTFSAFTVNPLLYITEFFDTFFCDELRIILVFLGTLSGINWGLFSYFCTIPLKFKINPARDSNQVSPGKAPSAQTTTQPER